MDSPIITGTDFISIGTRDFEAATRFYRDVLGLPMSVQWGTHPGGEFETGNLTIAVMQTEFFMQQEQRPHQHPIELRVDDFEAAYEELQRRGIEFKGEVIDSGVCKQAFFEDPDGNALAIHHRYAPKA